MHNQLHALKKQAGEMNPGEFHELASRQIGLTLSLQKEHVNSLREEATRFLLTDGFVN